MQLMSELHESKFPFLSRIEFIRSKLSNFSAHVSGVDALVAGEIREKGRSLGGDRLEGRSVFVICDWLEGRPVFVICD